MNFNNFYPGFRHTMPRTAFVFACLSFLAANCSSQEQKIKVSVDWTKTEAVSKTTITLQVVVNPPLRQGSTIHDRAWNSLRDLHADYVRFVPWYPYPRLGVAELEAPTPDRTTWDFSLIDPLVSDFFSATVGHPVMLNFSTIPQWMFRMDFPVKFPVDPNEVTWNYEQGQELRDTTGKEVANYYARLASWYAKGGFTDERGDFHASPFQHKIDLWEVLNEPEYEHAMSPQTYTRIYDAIVGEVRKVLPQTQFVGMSLAEPSNNPAFFEYFLDAKNHKVDMPLDWISYHFYAVPAADETPEIQQHTFFAQADKFLTSVKYIEAIRKRLSPQTKTAINEVGCILPADVGQGLAGTDASAIPNSYWNLCGAMFAYLYVNLARQGIEILSSSQLLGYPTQFPSVTMLDWKTGEPNARYWVLKLLRDNFSPGDRLPRTVANSPYILAQAFIAQDGARKLLVVNKRDRTISIQIEGATGGRAINVSRTAGSEPLSRSAITSDLIELHGYSVSVITFPR